MKLIVGLGNPDTKYKNTYHNIGFLVLDKITKGFVFDKKFNAEIKKEKNIIYLKPHTFMNLSGQSVSKVASYYKIKSKDIWVISDDINLPPGTWRFREKGSAGGHKGLSSIISELGTQNFSRYRIGIGIEEKIPTEKHVLKKIAKTSLINEAINKVVKAIKNQLGALHLLSLLNIENNDDG